MAKKPVKKPGCRPNCMIEFSQKLVDLICERMAKGETLRDICRGKDMPSDSLVRKWAIEDREGFYATFARARELQADAWADEIIAIASDTRNDTHTTTYGDGTERTSPNTEWISRSKLRVDTLKWLMSKIAHKTYGDVLKVDQKTEHSLSGSATELLESIATNGRLIPRKSDT